MCDGRKLGRHEWVSTMCALRKTMERPKRMEPETRRRHPCRYISANPFADQGYSLPPPGPPASLSPFRCCCGSGKSESPGLDSAAVMGVGGTEVIQSLVDGMWIRKTPTEIERERHRLWRAFGGPTVCCLIFFVGAALAPFSPGKHQFGPASLGEVLWFAIAAAVIAWIGAYLCQILAGRAVFSLFSRKVVICDTCYSVKNEDGQGDCSCGGKFETFDLWKWVEDDPGKQGEGTGGGTVPPGTF